MIPTRFPVVTGDSGFVGLFVGLFCLSTCHFSELAFGYFLRMSIRFSALANWLAVVAVESGSHRQDDLVDARLDCQRQD
jgi:hypothetical protein